MGLSDGTDTGISVFFLNPAERLLRVLVLSNWEEEWVTATVFAFAHFGELLGCFLAVAWNRVDWGEVIGISFRSAESDCLDMVDVVGSGLPTPVADAVVLGERGCAELVPVGLASAEALAGGVGAVGSPVFLPAGWLVLVAA